MRLPDIKRHTARMLGIPLAGLTGRSRAHQDVTRRWIAMTACRHYGRHSLPQIGRAFGRDHTTILVGLRAVEARCAKDADFFRLVAIICATLESEVLHSLRITPGWVPLPNQAPVALLPPPRRRKLPKVEPCPSRRIMVAA